VGENVWKSPKLSAEFRGVIIPSPKVKKYIIIKEKTTTQFNLTVNIIHS